MSVGSIGHWRDTAGGQIPGTAFAGFNMAGQQRLDDSAYSKPNDSTIEFEEAGDFLIWGHAVGTDGSNGRHTPQFRLAQIVGTFDLFTSYCSGYNRNNANNDWGVVFFAVCRGVAANDQVQLQWRRDTDAPTVGSTANASDIQVVRLGDSWNYGIYESASADNAYGGTTPNDVAFATTVVETDTAVIEKQVGDTDIRIKSNNKRFLILYSVAGDNGGSRTQRVGRLVSGSTEIDGSRTYFYQRSGSNEFTGLGTAVLHETATADEDISVQVYRGDGILANEGGADVDGSWSNNSGEETALCIIELPDNVEVFAAVDGTAGQDISGGVTTGINCCRTVNFNDAGSFTAPAIDTMDVTAAADVFFWCNLFTARSNVASGTRLTVGGRVEINGTDQTVGVHKVYTRGAQSTQDTFGGGLVIGGFFAASAGDDFQIETFDDGDNGAGDTTRANEVGAFAINLDTLAPSGGLVVERDVTDRMFVPDQRRGDRSLVNRDLVLLQERRLSELEREFLDRFLLSSLSDTVKHAVAEVVERLLLRDTRTSDRHLGQIEHLFIRQRATLFARAIQFRDTTLLAELVAAAKGKELRALDSIWIVDQIIKEALVTQVDPLFFLESVLRCVDLLRAENLFLNDQAVLAKGKEVFLRDGLAMVDSRASALEKVVLEQLLFLDVLARAREIVQRSSLLLSDSSFREIVGQGITRAVTDGLLFAEGTLKDLARTEPDSLVLDSFVGALDRTLQLRDGTLLVDQVEALKQIIAIFERLVRDSLLVGDEQALVRELRRLDMASIRDLVGFFRELVIETTLALPDTVSRVVFESFIQALASGLLSAEDFLGSLILAEIDFLGVRVKPEDLLRVSVNFSRWRIDDDSSV